MLPDLARYGRGCHPNSRAALKCGGMQTKGAARSLAHRAAMSVAAKQRTRETTLNTLQQRRKGPLPPGHDALYLAARSCENDRVKEARRLWAQYRVTVHDLALMIQDQGLLCLWCQQPLANDIAVHHVDTTTGPVVLAVLHDLCNRKEGVVRAHMQEPHRAHLVEKGITCSRT